MYASPRLPYISFTLSSIFCVFPINEDILLWCRYQHEQISVDTTLSSSLVHASQLSLPHPVLQIVSLPSASSPCDSSVWTSALVFAFRGLIYGENRPVVL